MQRGGSRGMSRQGSANPGYGGGGPVNLHKTENRWQAGMSIAEDPEEEKKQKTFKGILNKLTPDNYEKLKLQILAVQITHQKVVDCRGGHCLELLVPASLADVGISLPS